MWIKCQRDLSDFKMKKKKKNKYAYTPAIKVDELVRSKLEKTTIINDYLLVIGWWNINTSGLFNAKSCLHTNAHMICKRIAYRLLFLSKLFVDS